MSIDSLANLRRDYRSTPLVEDTASLDPYEQFERWFADASEAAVPEPNAMTLATVDASGVPSARIVLLKGVINGTFRFFTNHDSDKARDLDRTGRAALCFWWAELARQVRISGTTARLSREVCAEYFSSRPRGSQIGAWASQQSAPLPTRDVLAKRVLELEARFHDQDVPLPEFWGGYALTPTLFEFWQGQENRLHDRLAYRRTSDGWDRQRLSP